MQDKDVAWAEEITASKNNMNAESDQTETTIAQLVNGGKFKERVQAQITRETKSWANYDDGFETGTFSDSSSS